MSIESRKKRGKPSKIDQLPAEIKSKLDELLREGKLTQVAILEIVNAKILDAGLSEDDTLSAAGVNRYSTQMASTGQRIAEARAVSEQWVSKLGAKPSGEVSQILIEMVRTLAFEQVLNAANEGEPVHPKYIKDLAIGIEKLEKAASESVKREKEIRKAFAEEAANAVTNELRGQDGMSEEFEDRIREILLGKA